MCGPCFREDCLGLINTSCWHPLGTSDKEVLLVKSRDYKSITTLWLGSWDPLHELLIGFEILDQFAHNLQCPHSSHSKLLICFLLTTTFFADLIVKRSLTIRRHSLSYHVAHFKTTQIGNKYSTYFSYSLKYKIQVQLKFQILVTSHTFLSKVTLRYLQVVYLILLYIFFFLSLKKLQYRLCDSPHSISPCAMRDNTSPLTVERLHIFSLIFSKCVLSAPTVPSSFSRAHWGR